MARLDITVIGGGIVGLASAVQIQKKFPGAKVRVLEKEDTVAKHQTGHNSGVIHSGIYYKPGSAKALNCVRGYKLLLDYARDRRLSYDICGKLIVATTQAELPQLRILAERAIANGLEGVREMGFAEMREIEPNVAGLKGLFVPQTGIIDYRAVAEALHGDIRFAEGEVLLRCRVTAAEQKSKGWILTTSLGEVATDMVVNCGGLYSDKIGQMFGLGRGFKIIPFRGEYYDLRADRRGMVKNLIYPVPNPNFPFLGVHLTRMLNGGVEAGPNAVLAYAREGYSKGVVNPAELLETLFFGGFQKVALRYWRDGLYELYRSYSKTAFTKAVQKLLPDIQEEDLVEGGAGVRAQACDSSGKLLDDFVIEDGPRIVSIFNAPSPAATSSLSIGLTVAERLLKQLS